MTLGKFLKAMGRRIGTSLVFCFSFSVSNNVLEIFTTYNTVVMVIWVVELSREGDKIRFFFGPKLTYSKGMIFFLWIDQLVKIYQNLTFNSIQREKNKDIFFLPGKRKRGIKETFDWKRCQSVRWFISIVCRPQKSYWNQQSWLLWKIFCHW